MKRKDNLILNQRLSAAQIFLKEDDVNALRLAEKVLHRWHERECNGEIGLENGKWYAKDKNWRNMYRIPDKESGAYRRIASVCSANALYYYIQTDPRGCALYVSIHPLDNQNYSHKGTPCAV